MARYETTIMNNNQLEILDILAHNSKATVKDIDNLTGIGEDEIVKIIKDYEDTGVIVKYKTLINWEAAGREEVRALVEVRVTPQRDFGFDNVAERIARFPEVKSLSLVSGGFDLSVLIVGDNMRDLANFVAQKLAALEEVSGTATHFLLKSYKEDGEILGGEDDVHRLPIVP